MGGVWVHRLSDVDEVNETATCANCGPVQVKRRSRNLWRCAVVLKEEARSEWLKRQYGITEAEFLALMEAQSNRCAICSCEVGEDPCVDHCHISGAVRGILCRQCNLGLGYFRDDESALSKAIDYLNEHSDRNRSSE